ncbi:FAD-binding protein [Lacisediminimonas profundi]|uniref:FAD-binding protein n=1 Tax=Lacisediminimonas profundi TaxID=2603856 RepID=UPI00124B7BD1|nr:FAD-binding protein [Lacisediminimonas profundi]
MALPGGIGIEKRSADVLVVGGGGAASRAALSARQQGADVRLLTKAAFKTGGSTVQGASEIMSMGAAGFGDANDSRQKHFDDTMRAGRGFIDETLVRVLADDAPERIRDLVALGVPFDQESSGYKLIQSDFGSHARALGVKGKTGKAFVEALSDELVRSGVHIDEGIALVDLIRDADGSVAGVLGYDAARRTLVHYEAPSVVLGTGGAHSAFELQASSAEMTGDGQAICYRHGAELVNLEFHQLGPALIHPYVQLFSGSTFRLYPRMLNARGEEFLPSYLPPGVTMKSVYDEKGFPFTSNNVSRYLDIAMAHEVSEGRGSPHGGVYFSFAYSSQEDLLRVLPNTRRWLAERNIDLHLQQLEVGVVFQCLNGGVRMIDTDAQSSIPGLYVIGELAGGVRGPERPGGNSLAEGQVFGHRSGSAAAVRALARGASAPPATLNGTLDHIATLLGRAKPGSDLPDTAAMMQQIRHAMQSECLVEKTGPGMQSALDVVTGVQRQLAQSGAADANTLMDTLSLRNMALTSELLLRACLNRRESRSGHYRLDYPATDPQLAHSFTVRHASDGPAFATHRY